MQRTRRIPRCHVECSLRMGEELWLERPASHHLLTVLRASAGDVLELFNGDGRNYRAELIETGKRARVVIRAATLNLADSPLHTTLVQGISRGEKMDLTIQKCVELGLSRLSPIYTRRSIASLDEKRSAKKQEHWRSVAISACEQCGRSRAPLIDAPMSLADWLSEFGNGADPADGQPPALACVLSPGATHSLAAECRRFRARIDQGYRTGEADTGPDTHENPADGGRSASERVSASVTQLVGPESGLDADEVAAATDRGFTEVQLGPRILRTETAGLAAMTLVQALCGDLDDARLDRAGQSVGKS